MSESDLSPSLEPGLSAEVETTVSEAEAAAHLGSGTIAVYATPALVALMENAAVRALEGYLQPGQTTVGGRIDVRHLAATPVGMRVRAHAELVEVQGRKLSFRIQAWDEVEQIGEASHIRFIVEESSFMERARGKGK
ncbi:MAG: thioesterase family protein [Anaerolineales bacterium]|nr:thioesterase family protein [Anaerolineales bacterium]